MPWPSLPPLARPLAQSLTLVLGPGLLLRQNSLQCFSACATRARGRSASPPAPSEAGVGARIPLTPAGRPATQHLSPAAVPGRRNRHPRVRGPAQQLPARRSPSARPWTRRELQPEPPALAGPTRERQEKCWQASGPWPVAHGCCHFARKRTPVPGESPASGGQDEKPPQCLAPEGPIGRACAWSCGASGRDLGYCGLGLHHGRGALNSANTGRRAGLGAHIAQRECRRVEDVDHGSPLMIKSRPERGWASF